MSRATLVLTDDAQRAKAINWVSRAPRDSLVTFERPRRTTDQNRKLWPMLTEITEQRPIHNGVRMTPELYKAVFMQALGCEMVMLPTMDGDGFFPLGHRSSKLSVGEFSALIELIHAFAARHGVTLREEEGV